MSAFCVGVALCYAGGSLGYGLFSRRTPYPKPLFDLDDTVFCGILIGIAILFQLLEKAIL